MPSILILEDDITFSLMLKTWLGRKGFEVSSVSSVSDARSRIEDASFDLILSDLRLPDGDGIDLLKWIKENMPCDVYVSIMAQYFPTYKAKEDELLNRKINKKEYKEVENYLYTLGLENGYMQELGEHEEEYVPKWEI